MKNELMNFEGHNVEVIEVNGKVLFNPYHVAEILDIKNVRDNISKMNGKQVVKLTNSDVGNPDIRKLNNAGENFLTESGVYKLVFKSHKENAERFQDWVTDDVLPSIRKTGSYNVPQMSVNELIFEMAKSNLETEKRLKSLEESVSKTSERMDKALEAFTNPCSYTWTESVKSTVKKMCESTGKTWSVIYGDMYRDLENECGCDLSRRVKYAQERAKKSGHTVREQRAITKLSLIEKDKKLRTAFEYILKKYQVRYLQGDNVQEYI